MQGCPCISVLETDRERHVGRERERERERERKKKKVVTHAKQDSFVNGDGDGGHEGRWLAVGGGGRETQDGLIGLHWGGLAGLGLKRG